MSTRLLRVVVPALVLLVAGLAAPSATGTAPARIAMERGARPVAVPPAGQAVDTSHPTRWVGSGTPGQLHVGRGRPRGAQGRDHPVPLRTRPGRIEMKAHRQGGQHQQARGARRRRPGHAQRRREAPDPLPEHLRPRADLDDVALRRPGHARGWSSRTSRFARGNSTGQTVRRRRRRRDLRARRPAEDRRLALRRQPLRPARPGPRRARPCARCRSTTTCRSTSSAAPSPAGCAATAAR